MTTASAIIALASWIGERGNPPKAKECIATNGLPNYTTLLKHFGSFQIALAAANTYSASGISAVAVYVRGDKTKKKCMNCGETIKSQSLSIRHCEPCRNRLFSDSNAIEVHECKSSSVWSSDDLCPEWSDILDNIDWSGGGNTCMTIQTFHGQNGAVSPNRIGH
jgi:hypothetical protein